MLGKNLLRLDMKSNSKTGEVRKIYSFVPKSGKKPQVKEKTPQDIKTKELVPGTSNIKNQS